MDINKNPYSLRGKYILVTGASSNIGRQIAIRCSEMGGSMVIVGRNKERLQESFDALLSSDNKQIVFDLQNRDEICSFVDQLPVLDGIVLSAAIFDTTVVHHIRVDKMIQMFETNSFSNIILVQQLLKKKKISPSGSIVFISSVASFRPYKGNALYSATTLFLRFWLWN